MGRTRRDRLGTRRRMDAYGCAIAIWSDCSPCCESAMWWRSTESATSRSHKFSAAWRTRRWSRMRRPQHSPQTRRAGNNEGTSSQEDIMQIAITFMAIVAGMVFSLGVALLAEELIFGQVFRLFFFQQTGQVKSGQKNL